MLVDIGDVLGQTQVAVSVRLVLDQPEEVETGKQRSRQLNVLLDALPGIVAAIGRVGCCQNGAACVERGHDASLETRRREKNKKQKTVMTESYT